MLLKIAKAAASGLAGASNEVQSGLANKVAGFFDYIIGRVPSWIAGVIVFVLSIIVAKLAKSAVESRIESQIDEEHQEVLVLAGRVTYFGTLVVGITVALKIAGIDLTTILAAVAFGIGFALQDLIMNFLSGVLILVSRQITIGDFIKVGSTLGKVVEIQTRATILKAVDGTKVIVPNSEIFTSQVVSYTTNPMRRIAIPLYVSYDTNLGYAMKTALDVLKRHPKIVKKPASSVLVTNYGDSSIDLSARFWVGSRDGWIKIKSEIMHQMMDAFNEAGIVVPFNIMHVETNADTAEDIKHATEIAKKKMEEAQLSKAIEADAKVAPSAVQVAPSINDNSATATPAAPSAKNGTQNLPAAPQLAAVTVPIEPPGAYADQEEIDGQA
ncbi:mechanosensitive ion channel [Candidatus Peregrinibacteria bacterium]|nr:mechanosensitive ion channel [Candidatus Peregrinibacteria bacterium]